MFYVPDQTTMLCSAYVVVSYSEVKKKLCFTSEYLPSKLRLMCRNGMKWCVSCDNKKLDIALGFYYDFIRYDVSYM